MAREISIGAQGFADIRKRGAFLVDKTGFIGDWWCSYDKVTLICRPRRFGKTLNLDMLECFFSTRYAGRDDLFEGLEVWRDEALRAEQGTWPVVAISFADVKAPTFDGMVERITGLVADLYRAFAPLFEGIWATGEEDYAYRLMTEEGDETDLSFAIRRLCAMLNRLTGKNAIVLLDEYDTPLQEAWFSGYWEQASDFFRGLFNSTLKTNDYLERALVTGITRVARESIFSDLNNLEVVTTSSDKYETAFGFTQAEVDEALGEFGLADASNDVRAWYDGFRFGSVRDIYNPWSITNYLDKRRLDAYWANTSGNGLVSSLVSQGDAQLKSDFESLLDGGTVREIIGEQISFPDLNQDPAAVWSLLVSSGYMKILSIDLPSGDCELAITNYETRISFERMVRRWFAPARVACNGFVRALIAGDLEAMNDFMNEVALETFSVFDTGNRPSPTAPERFYHGFVLGLLIDLHGRYAVRSNRESGYGRYDVMLVPNDPAVDPGIIIEFKVRKPQREATLEDTVAAAHAQIEEKGYAAELVASGVPRESVRAYGFAFEGKRVLIG